MYIIKFGISGANFFEVNMKRRGSRMKQGFNSSKVREILLFIGFEMNSRDCLIPCAHEEGKVSAL